MSYRKVSGLDQQIRYEMNEEVIKSDVRSPDRLFYAKV